MKVHVATGHKTRPEHTDQVLTTLREALPDSLAHDGCQAIHLRRDQDDPTHIVSFTQWASRRHYENYLAWRTDTGLKDEIGQLLTEPVASVFCLGTLPLATFGVYDPGRPFRRSPSHVPCHLTYFRPPPAHGLAHKTSAT